MLKIRALFILTGLLLAFDNLPGQTERKLPRKYKRIEKYIQEATQEKLAGVVVYVQNPAHGEWTASSGSAHLESKETMQADDIFSLASIGKMYNAMAVLKLVEEGRIRLDEPITSYLTADITNPLPKAKEVTIRHLLAHQSGFVNYEADPELVRLYTSGQLKLDTLSHLNALKRYVFDKPALCLPGTAYHYSSTNYMLLAMIMDRVVPEGHSAYLRSLLKQHGYMNTYYRQTPPQKNIHYYGDLNTDEVMEDLTAQTFETTNWFMGDDGVYAPIAEAAHFLQDLMNGKVLSQQTLNAMKTWNNNKKPDYGLGLMADKSFPYGFLLGHSGRGIGVTTDLYYFPKRDMTVAIFCNTGLRGAAPGFKKVYNKMRARIVKKLFLF